jgi:hypothetical protein
MEGASGWTRSLARERGSVFHCREKENPNQGFKKENLFSVMPDRYIFRMISEYLCQEQELIVQIAASL